MKSKLIGVFGNNYAERELLKSKFKSYGHDVKSRFSSLEIDEVRIALLHGDEPNLLDEIVRSQSYDLVVSGHIHSISKSRTGKTVSLNPGEVCGYLSGSATIVTFDTSKRIIEILNV